MHLCDGAVHNLAALHSRFAGRNLWDRRYAVVDEERGIVLTILRFGKVDGVQHAASVTSIDRIMAEFFTITSGKIQDVQAR
jgi:hypothetical protein